VTVPPCPVVADVVVDATRATELIPSVPLGNSCLFSLVVSNSGSVVGGTFPNARKAKSKAACRSSFRSCYVYCSASLTGIPIRHCTESDSTSTLSSPALGDGACVFYALIGIGTSWKVRKPLMSTLTFPSVSESLSSPLSIRLVSQDSIRNRVVFIFSFVTSNPNPKFTVSVCLLQDRNISVSSQERIHL
jgi:hypothetical protein